MGTDYEVDVKAWIKEINNARNENYKIFENSNVLAINHDQKSLHIKQLIHGDDYNFITNLYHGLLGRHTDHQGLEYYSAQLKQGASKLRLIKQVMHSDEGKKNGVKIKGLFIYTLLNISGIKSFFEFLTSMLVFPRLIKEQNKLKQAISIMQNVTNHLFETQDKIIQILQSHGEQIGKLLDETGAQMDQQIVGWDNFYKEFENEFRGPFEEIKKRMSVYLPTVQAIQAKIPDDFTLLDMGPGRGEWLELLKANQINAFGVDLNKESVESCNQRNLHVVYDNVIEYLYHQQANIYGFVTGFHIIEHLTFANLMNLLDEIKRTLKEGGGVILETPNPMNIIVACNAFYCDPTHRRPIPSDLMKYLLIQKGFKDVQIIALNPVEGQDVEENNELTKRFNHLVYGPRDYAVIGYK